jgi:hypothetical protein
MTGKKGRSGRRRGSFVWNSTRIAGYMLGGRLEFWLAVQPYRSPSHWPWLVV